MKNFTLLFITILLHSSFARLNAQNINKPNISGPAGLKVNSFSGSLFYQRNDLMIPGRGLSIDLTFYYNSSTTAIDFGFGPGWSNTYSMKCTPDSNKVIIRREDGRKDVYLNNGSAYVAPIGIFDTLVKYQPGKFRLTSKHGISYFFDDSTHHRLTGIINPNSNSMTIAYTDSMPVTITDASNRHVTLVYSGGHLSQVIDANFSPARTVTYQYDGSGNPITVTDPLGNSIHYQYDVARNITKLTDELSNHFDISYNNCKNVSGITSPLNSLSFAMDTVLRKTTVTEMVNGNPQSTSYTYSALGNLAEKIGNCCGYHVSYTYDAMKNITQKTDAKGYSSNYTYDSKGNMLTETDPFGFSRTLTYEPVYNRITNETDKNGNSTGYIYDANGNLLQVNKPLSITENYTYNGFGEVASYMDARGFTTQYVYNSFGDLTLVTFPGGATRSFGYDYAGNQTSDTDENAHTTNRTYDKLNRSTQTTDALANTTTYSYDARSSLISKTDPLGHITSYSYDALGRMISTTNPSGTSSATYDEKGNALTTTDNKGNVSHFTYNAQNLPTTETDPLSHSRNFTYDPNGNRNTETDFIGHLTTYLFDSLNRLKTVTDALSNTTNFAYDGNGNRTSVKDANNHTTSIVYNALNKVTQVNRPLGTTTFAYDAAQNNTAITDPNGHATNYVYDNRNRLTSQTDALSHATAYAYDAAGNNTAETDRNGHTTTYAYDALNRRTSSLYPLGYNATCAYDAVGNITAKTIPNGNIKSYTYDASYRIISQADLIGNLTSYTYDANSNPLTQTDALGHAMNYAYDALNRVTSVTDHLGHLTTYSYNNNSSVISVTDMNGNTTQFLYDGLERKIITINQLGDLTYMGYNAVGNVNSRTDANGNTTAYSYDNNDRLITETFANSSAINYSYDARGNRVARTDPNGNTTAYSYDANDRLITRNYPGSNDDNFTYDNEDRMNGANNSNAAITFTFDNADQLLTETMNGKTTSYTNDIPNKKRFVSYPGGRIIEEDYDYRARMSAIKESSTSLAAFTYDLADRMLTRTYQNGVVANFSYNNNNWTTGISHIGSSSIAEFNYNFDNNGNRLSEEKIHHVSSSEKYTYDTGNKLTNYKSGTLSAGNIPAPLTQTQYNYDGPGNRTTVVHDALTTTYTPNNVNEYTAVASIGTVTPVYDANGNMLNDGTHVYAYDFENRLVEVDGGTTAVYKYDALGRRIQKVTTAGTINYFYDGQFMVEERNASDVVTATYISGAEIDNILSMSRGGNTYFYHHNSLGSVVAITDNTGTAAERYEYDAYGKPTIFDNAYSLLAATAIGNTFMFTGREYDAETANYHYRARSYNPVLGRFMQQDPIGNWGDMNNNGNGVSYVGNNPVNEIDPMGLFMVVGRRGRNGLLECLCGDGAGFNSENAFDPGYRESYGDAFPARFGFLCRSYCMRGHHGLAVDNSPPGSWHTTPLFNNSILSAASNPFENEKPTPQAVHVKMLTSQRELRERIHNVASPFKSSPWPSIPFGISVSNSGTTNENSATTQGPRSFLSATPNFDSGGSENYHRIGGDGIPDVDVGLKKRTGGCGPSSPPTPPTTPPDMIDDVVNVFKAGWKWLTGG